jgi:hypothetical protein
LAQASGKDLSPSASDEARRARAESDYQIHRAVKLASDNDEVKKLRTEVVKLLETTN